MSTISRGRGRGGRGIVPNNSEDGIQPQNGLEANAESNQNAVIIDLSDCQPSQPNAPKRGILRNGTDTAVQPNILTANGNATNGAQQKLPMPADASVPFGGIQMPTVVTATGRGTRGMRGGLGRGTLHNNSNNDCRSFNGHPQQETSPPKSVTFDSTTVFNGRARGSGGASRGLGRGANAVELGSNAVPSIGTLLRGGVRGRGRGASSEGQNGGLSDSRPNCESNGRGRESYADRRGGGGRGSESGGERFGRGRGAGGERREFGERPTNYNGQRRSYAENGGDEHFPRNESRPRHFYKKREIESLYEEDFLVSERYVGIREEDEDLSVFGCQETFTAFETWADFGLEQQLLDNINRCKYVVPRKIQSYTFPLIRGGFDVKALAETSSGKSAAFLLPIIDKIIKLKKEGTFKSRRGCPYALVLSPYRELVIQIYEQTRKLCNGCGVSVSWAYGGTIRHENIREISIDGCDILIGTPGRIRDFFQSKYLMFDLLKVLVLDEADELLEDKFVLDLRALEEMPNWPSIESRQTLLFSATFYKEVREWADEFMRPSPFSLFVSKGDISSNKRIRQTFVMADKTVKKHTLVRLLQLEQEQNEQLDRSKKLLSTMVFVNTRSDAEIVSNFLNSRGFSATTISGSRNQPTREKAVWDFRTGEFPIIVTTDVCARGHDIKNLERVINLDLPVSERPEDAYYRYVQRIGRTGRIQQGMSTSFFDPSTDMGIAPLLVQGLNHLSQSVPSWLQSAAKEGFVEGQGSSLSDHNLLTSAGIPQVPDTMPNFDFPPPSQTPPENVTPNGHNGAPEEQQTNGQSVDDSLDSLFDVN